MNWVSLAIFFGLVLAAAFLGGQWGANAWYRLLKKPSFTPPNWLFGVAWPILYGLIATSGWFVWQADHPLRGVALALWAAQLGLNGIWSYLFFGRRDMTAGLIDICLLLGVIAVYIAVTMQFSLTAAALFAPYLVWVGFASILNWRIRVLNTKARS